MGAPTSAPIPNSPNAYIPPLPSRQLALVLHPKLPAPPGAYVTGSVSQGFTVYLRPDGGTGPAVAQLRKLAAVVGPSGGAGAASDTAPAGGLGPGMCAAPSGLVQGYGSTDGQVRAAGVVGSHGCSARNGAAAAAQWRRACPRSAAQRSAYPAPLLA
jgi:hypothetical protein